MSDFLAVLPQYLLPKKALTVFAGKVAGARGGQWTTGLIRWFVKRYQVNMDEAANPDIAAYASFIFRYLLVFPQNAQTYPATV